LTRERRLTRPDEFKLAFAKGKRRRQAPLALVYRHAPESAARLGLAVSRKQARSAVLRNRIKRQAREIFRQRADTLPLGDYVIYAVSSCEGLHKRELGQHLVRLFEGATR
jgi:ribonuclease P protein component, eubacterial